MHGGSGKNAKALLAKRINPSQHAKLQRITKRASHAVTFRAVADEDLLKIAKEGNADTTQNKKEWLLGLAMRDIGSRPVSEITAAEIRVPLKDRIQRQL